MTDPLRDVLVPRVFLADPDGFGGAPAGDCLRGDLVLAASRPVALRRAEPTARPRTLMPWLTEAHCHLDKCHTAHRMPQTGGDLAHAIALQSADKAHWTPDDIAARAARGLAEAATAGCRLVRSHVDWGDGADPPVAWEVLGGLATGPATLQRAALVNTRVLLQDGAAIARHIAAANGALGLFIADQPDRAEAIALAFQLTDRFGLMLDFHVDEGLAPGLNGLEVIADAALAARFGGPVLCGHACSLMNRDAGDTARIADKLARSGIHVAALPSTNLYLQGRTGGTPDRRGLTRLRELDAAGVAVVVGSDNVGDAFCPAGRHDPLFALHLAHLAAHLDPPLERWLPAVTTTAAGALGRAPVMADRAAPGELALYAGTPADLVAGRAGPPEPLTATTDMARP